MTKNSIASLTVQRDSLILSPPLTHSRVGIRTPHIGDITPLSTVVFLCPVIIKAGLIRFKFFMVGCIERPLKRSAVPLCGSSNLIQSTAQDFELKCGGLFLNKGHKPMLNPTQNPLNISVSKNNTLKSPLKSRFNVFTRSRSLVAKDVTFDQAILYPRAIVKFSCMVGGVA